MMRLVPAAHCQHKSEGHTSQPKPLRRRTDASSSVHDVARRLRHAGCRAASPVSSFPRLPIPSGKTSRRCLNTGSPSRRSVGAGEDGHFFTTAGKVQH